MDIETIAQVAHETNRAYCSSVGDDSQPAWADAPGWQRDSAIDGVHFHLNNPEAGCSGSHENWLKLKEAEGWSHGLVKDSEKKEHPCFVPYEQLPAYQKVKDALFVGVVRAMKVLLE
jgi:hypothetical protein